ncbi:polyphosphate:nucleotide phosphotransferase, PPK2 family [Galbibacter orientalis DSM 19592]|uniref:Polyphosphate:nucleotide phosphotransferase, PPK2 family n=2 Tax=Galbibacter TaxID=379068 RepID=I3C0P0_9FLAO|nr:PPK2 family polyphosphate kinase [Galbibacter orientalis]EIJ37183.1 polyphosphate:nucleotide phosphotransferase, PPK2 family [Galbibacter orientalis DSM 19592]
MDSIKTSHYRVDKSVKLKEIATLSNLNATDDELKEHLKDIRKKLGKFQDVVYAHGKYSVLICLQGIDTAGKDSLIREVFKDFNSRGVVVHSFKVPTELEKKHDFLWRHYIALPARGKFGVFNRTHYENVLVTRVHPEYILAENLPEVKSVEDVNEAFWHRRFEQIKNFEKHLVENGTIIFKFFLHLSKDEQKNRLLRRLNLEDKNWKFSPADLKERALWDKYQACYEEAINITSTPYAPWFIIPADNKKAARVIVADILYDELKDYKDVEYPELNPVIKEHLNQYKEQLNKE